MTMTNKQFNAAVKTVVKIANSLQEKVASLAVIALQHAQEHGDATRILYLCQALPKGQRVQALKLWTHAFSPIKLQNDTDGNFVGVKIAAKTSKNYVEWNIDEAIEKPYFTLTQENAPQPLTLEALMRRIKGMVKAADKADEEGRIDPSERENIYAYIAALNGVAVPAQAAVH